MISSACRLRRSWSCTQMTHQRQWDFLQVLMWIRKRSTTGGIILDSIATLLTNMCLSGLLILLLSSKYSLLLLLPFFLNILKHSRVDPHTWRAMHQTLWVHALEVSGLICHVPFCNNICYFFSLLAFISENVSRKIFLEQGKNFNWFYSIYFKKKL